MIRHIAVFRWKPEATAEQKAAVATELAKLPAIVASIRSFVIFPDAGITPGNAEFPVTANFDYEAGFAAYPSDPTHRALFAKHIRHRTLCGPHVDPAAGRSTEAIAYPRRVPSIASMLAAASARAARSVLSGPPASSCANWRISASRLVMPAPESRTILRKRKSRDWMAVVPS